MRIMRSEKNKPFFKMDFFRNQRITKNKENKVNFFRSLNLFKNYRGFKEVNANEIELTNNKIRVLLSHLNTSQNDEGSLKTTKAEVPQEFQCDLCPKAYPTKTGLNRHNRNRHSTIRRLSCTVCNKGFNDGFDLKRHTRIHTGVQPYKCEECGKAFTQLVSLEAHQTKIHKTAIQYSFKENRAKTYVCEACGEIAHSAERHFAHLKSKHPNSVDLKKAHDKRAFKNISATKLTECSLN